MMAMLLSQARDTFHTRVPLDTIVVETPVPAIQPVFDLLLNLPTAIQAAGALLVTAALAGVAVLSWRMRRRLRGWLAGRSRAAQLALAAVMLVALGSVAAGGAWIYDYTEHQNAFCNSCHIMNDAYMRFAGSEHADLGCHDCHRQSMYASVRQLVLWVAERPEEIPPHSPVPSEICGSCHLQWQPDSLWLTEEAWRNVVRTAGHQVHLESSDPALAGLQCVDCHGQQVHRFIPVEQTCLSSGCHDGLEIRLGRMATMPQAFHCAGCHAFTTPIEATPVFDPGLGRSAVSPRLDQCYGCHEMELLLPRSHMASEPHAAACGVCHNPHTQVQVAEAAAGCTAAGCHDVAEQLTPFHRGLQHGVVESCTTCHTAHDFRVVGSDCLSCHTDIYDDVRVARAWFERR